MQLHGRSFVVALLCFAAILGLTSEAAVAGPGPDLVVTSITAPPTASEAASISISWTVMNQGSAPAIGPWNDNVLISVDGMVGSDLFINAFARAGTLAPGESYTQTQTIMLPQGVFGPAFIAVTTDSGNVVPEGPAGEANNSAIDDAPIAITAVYPDVVIDAASITAPSMPNPGSTITVGWIVRNQGGVAADWQAIFTTPSWRISLSDDTIAGDADDVLLSNFNVAIPGGNVLSPGESQSMTRDVTLPQTTTGMRYIVLTCDRNNNINEGPTGELNNVTADLDAMTISANFPDLVVTSIDVTPVPNVWGRPVMITWTVQNQGNAPATGGSWIDQLRVSADAAPSLSTDIFLVNLTRPAEAATLAPGATYTLSSTINYSAFLSDISYFFVAADVSNDLGEGPTGEANNITVNEGITLLNPDVVIDAASITAPPMPNPGSTITVGWTVRNDGLGYANWTDIFTTPTWRISLSDDTIAGDADDVLLSNFNIAIPGGNIMDPGESQMMTRDVILPAGTTGMRYIIVQCDRNNNIPEGTVGEANNFTADIEPIDIQANFPDLVVTSIDVTPVPNVWGRPVMITWTVQNQGNAPATGGSWIDQLRVSADAAPSLSTDIFLVNLTRPAEAATLAPGATYTLSSTINYSAFLSDISYFFVAADVSNDLGEGPTGETNNITIDEGIELLNPDVVIDAASISAPPMPNPGTTITVGWTVRNDGLGYANWTDIFTTPTWSISLSDDTIVGDADDVLLSNFNIAIPGGNILDPGESQMMTRDVILPAGTTGMRYVIVRCDRNNNIPEGTAGEANNFTADIEPIDIQANFPDLVVTSIEVTPVPNVWGRPVMITWTVQNQGTAPATGVNWIDQLRVSADATPSISADIFVVNLNRPAGAATLAPGATYTLSTTLPYTAFLSGISYFFVAADVSNDLGEGPTGETNNITIDEGIELLNPDVVIDPASIIVPGSAEPGSIIAVQWTVRNDGLGYANWTDIFTTPTWSISLSDDTIVGDADDVLLSNFNIAIPGGNILDPGESQMMTRDVTLPVVTGARYIIVRCDRNNNIPEGAAGEANNFSLDTDAVAVQSLPNLRVPEESISVPSSVSVGQEIQVSWNVQNSGNGPASGTWTDEFLLSTDRLVGNDIALGSATFTGTLSAGQSYTAQRTITVPPEATGTFFFLVRTDTANVILEVSEADNFSFDVDTLTGNRPDLVPQMVSAPSEAVLGQSFVVSWNDANLGTGDAIGTWFDRVVLSANDIYGDADDIQLASQAFGGPIAPAAIAMRSVSATISAGVAAGEYRIFVRSDSTDAIPESNELNNTSAGQLITVGGPDLAPSLTGAVVPATGTIGRSYTVQFNEENLGTIAATGTWLTEIVLSVDGVIGGADDIGSTSVFVSGPLNPGAAVMRTFNLTVPAAASGVYNVIARSDFTDAVREISESNNALVLGQVTIGAPDLVPIADGATFPSSAAAGQSVTVQWTERNDGNREAGPNWSNRVVLSVNEIYGDGDDVFVSTATISTPLAAGASASRSVTFSAPLALSGSVFILTRSDISSQIAESNETNNTVTLGTIMLGGTPDLRLAATGTVVPPTAMVGVPFIVQYRVRNGGTVEAPLPWNERLVLSTNTIYGDADDIVPVVIASPGALAPDAEAARMVTMNQPAGLIHHWPGDGNANDIVGGQNGTISGAVAFGVGARGQAFEFSGGEVGCGTTAGNFGTSDFTIAYWVRVTNSGSVEIISKRAVCSFGSFFDIRNGALEMYADSGGSCNSGIAVPLPTDGVWRHVAYTRQGTTMRSYLNGTLQTSRGTACVANVNNTAALRFSGGPCIGTDGSVRLAGGLDDVRIYSRALSEEEIRSVAGIAGVSEVAPEPAGNLMQMAVAAPRGASGPLNVIVRLDSDGMVTESNESNNTAVLGSVSIDGAGTPDLVAEATSGASPPSATIGQQVFVQWQDRNIGTAPVAINWSDRVVFSVNDVFGDGDDAGAVNVIAVGPLADGDTLPRSTTLTVPSLAAGTYRLLVRADFAGVVTELNEANNTATIGMVQVGVPDLSVASIDAPTTGVVGSPLNITWQASNIGSSGAIAPWTDRVWLSTDATLGGDTLVGNVVRSMNLAPAASYDAAIAGTFPAAPGSYWVIVQLDVLGQVPEAGAEANNVQAFGPIAVSPPPGPDLVVTQVTVPSNSTAGDTITAAYTVTNAGTEPASVNWQDAIYLSSDTVLDGSDQQVRLSPANQAPLAPGASYSFSRNISLPLSFDDATLYVIVRTDQGGAVTEQNESNNSLASSPIAVAGAPGPDLAASDASAPSAATFGSTISVSWTVNNTGSAPAESPWSDAVFLSADAVLSTTDRLIGSRPYSGPAITPGGPGYGATADIPLPVDQTTLPGTYFILVRADGFSGVNETNENNNVTAFGPITIDLPPLPNARVVELSAPADAAVGQPFNVTFRIENAGPQPATGSWLNEIRLVRQSGAGDSPIVAVTEFVGTIAPGALSAVQTASFLLPDIGDTTFTVSVETNINRSLLEASTADNRAESSPATAYRRPDLRAASVLGPATGTADSTISVTYAIDNDGPAAVLPFWVDAVYLSSDAAPGNDILLGTSGEASALGIGEAYMRTISFPVPGTLEGEFFLIVETDRGNRVIESGGVSANNFAVAASPIMISQPPRPNLIVETVIPPMPGLSGAPMQISWTVRNVGLGAAAGFWTDRVFVSADRTLSPDDVALNDFSNPNPLASGESYTLTRSLFYPSAPGEYFLIVSTDALAVINEGISGDENDNAGASLTPLTVTTFTATATASIESAPAGTPVTIAGVATVASRGGGIAADVPVVVRANVGGFERRLTDRTDVNGEYSVVFQPGPTEGGMYGVAAGPEHVIGLAPTDSFSLWSLVAQPSAAFVTANPMLVSNGQFTLRNPGNQAQSGLLTVVTGVPSGVNVQVEINPGGAASIGPNSTVPVAYSVLADQEIITPFVVGVEISSDQGAIADFDLNLRVFPAQPALALVQEGLISGRLSKNLLRGERAYAQFEVQNLGTGATGPLTIVLPPALEWMRAATPSPLPSLGPGQRASVVLQLDPPGDLPLAVYAGSLAVNGMSTGVTVPFRFSIVSEGVGDLLVRATDEFTYYAEGMPRVEGASVTVKQNGTGNIVAAGLTKENGEIRFDGLTEAYYDLEVTAEDHGTFRTTILVGGGDVTNVEAFMPRQLVRYSWTVTPTDFIDTYTIRIQATFQTQVPAPVVVVEPSYVDLTDVPLPTQINYTITNHGLIAAPNLRFNVGESDLFELVPLVDTFGTLPGMSSVEVPVLVLPKGGQRSLTRGDCGAAVSFACFDLMCGDQTYTYCGPTIAASGNCSSGPGGSGGGGGGGGGGFGPGGGSGGPGGGSADSFIYPPVVSQPVGCDPCIIKCIFSGLQCVPGLGCGAGLAGGCGFPKVGTTGKIISSVAGCMGAAVNCGVNLTPLAGQLSCACGVLRDCGLCQLSGPDIAGLFPCSPGDIISSAGSGLGMLINGRGIEPESTGIPIVDYYQRLYVAYMYRYFVLAEIFGNVNWILLDENNSEEFEAFLAAFALVSDEKGSSGLRISETERSTLLASARPYQITEADVDAFIARWNRSLDYYDLGIMTDDQLPAGWNPDFINALAVEQAATFAYDVEQEAMGQQFENIIDALNYAREVLYRSVVPAVAVGSSGLRGGGEGVCAEVRIQLDQTLTLTRTAFTARLELENQSDAPLEAIAIDVLIRDEDGVDATNRFVVFPPEITGGLTAVDGTGTLPGMMTGVSAWTILPTDEAAPLVPTRYYVSGTLAYATDGQVLTIPLFPIVITVQPDPSLQLNYFLETVVYADDPFTPELEPSIPFSLGLIVKNNGAGIARDLSITSAQPEIIENDRGLLIDFDIIGTQVGLEQIAPSLTVNLGDIGPDETNVARWLMICSLQGEFTGYSASYEHITGLGDPRLSLIESVDIFGLNHVVRDVRPAADQLPDFLTNDFPDPRNLPDTLHLSTGVVDDIDTDVNAATTLGPGPREATFDADSGPRWNYYRVTDPFDASLRLLGARRSDGSMLLFPDNVWQTSRINRLLPGSPIERFIHVFDFAGDGQYTLIFDPDSEAPTVLAAKSVHTHGSGVGEVGLDIDPDSTFSEPRGGGLSTILYTFSEPIEANTFTPVNLVVDGFNADGTPVDLSGVTELLALNKGDTVGRVVFDPPLPPRARYCVQLVGVTDRSGNPVIGDEQRLNIVVLPGDASGDARVNPTDTGGVGSLVGTNPIDPTALFQVRSDMNLDGRVDTADVEVVLANRRVDLRTTPNPCLTLVVGDPTARQPDKTIAGGSAGLDRADGDAGNPTGGPAFEPNDNEPINADDLKANSLDSATRRLAYEFAGQQSVLAFDDLMIAVFDAADAADVPALLGDYGIDPAGIHPWPIDGWWTAALPKNLSTDDARRELQRVIEQSGARVAPVLRDDDGAMVIPSGTILVRFKAGVPDAWARQVIEQSSGAGAAIMAAFAGVDGLYAVNPVNIFGESALELATKLTARKDVDFAETEMLFANFTDRADDNEGTPALVKEPDVALLGDDASLALIEELRAAATALSADEPVVDAVRVLLTRDGLCAGSTAELALALHAAAERGGRVALLDLNIPFGSKTVAEVIARVQARGVTAIVPERAGLLGLIPGVIRASEDVSTTRLTVIIDLINTVNPADRDALLDRLRADPALGAVRESLPDARRTGDLNADGLVTLDDALHMLGAWGAIDSLADLNADGTVTIVDLNMLLEVISDRTETPESR